MEAAWAHVADALMPEYSPPQSPASTTSTPFSHSASRSGIRDGMDFSLLWAALVDPSKMLSMALSLVSFPPSTLSQETSFYPPLNAISYITDSTYGTFGGVFNAPTEKASPTTSGAYNYCTMPHPHRSRYQPPSPVQNGSVEAQLVYVEYMQRHQRRTAYNILPGGEVGTANLVPIARSDQDIGSTVQLRQCSPISLCWTCGRQLLPDEACVSVRPDIHRS